MANRRQFLLSLTWIGIAGCFDSVAKAAQILGGQSAIQSSIQSIRLEDSLSRERFAVLIGETFYATSEARVIYSLPLRLVAIRDDGGDEQLQQFTLVFQSDQGKVFEGIYDMEHYSAGHTQMLLQPMDYSEQYADRYCKAVFNLLA